MPKGRADGLSIPVSPFFHTKATVFLLSLFCAIHKCGRSLYVRIFYFSKAWKYGTASFHRAFARFHKGDTRRQLNSHIGKEYRVRGNARGNEHVKARKTRSTSRRAGAQETIPGMWWRLHHPCKVNGLRAVTIRDFHVYRDMRRWGPWAIH